MEQYKISQRPSGGGKKPVKRKKPVKAAKRKQAQSLDSKMILIAVVIGLALLLGGLAFARYMMTKDDAPANQTPAAVAKERAGEKGEISPETFNGVTTAIGSKQIDGLNRYYANKVRVRILKGNVNKTVDGKQVGSLIGKSINDAETPWNWNVPPSDLSAWQQGPHGEEFIGNVIVGVSPDGTVIVIHIDENGNIDEVFIAPVSELTNPSTPPTTTNPTPNPATPEEPTPETPVIPVSPSGDNTAD